ncbi:alpha/beta fold hydrolase [Sinomicrobium sp. M5D2P17]
MILKTKLPLPVLFLFMSALLACSDTKTKTDTEFKIAVKKSNLYVRMVGNTDGPLLINLHGGPGAFSGFDHEFNRMYLEDDYLIAYLDQRGSGKSDVEKDSTMLNIEQFVKDLDVVVDSLKNKYKNRPVNLIGSSWGGTLGLLYMIKHQGKINTFTCVSGKADGVYPILALVEHERELAEELLKKSDDPEEQDRYRKILSRLQEIEQSNFDQLFEDVNLLKHTFPEALGFNVYWANEEARKEAVELGKTSGYYERAHYTKAEFDTAMQKFEYVNRVFRNTSDYNNLNIIDEIGVITKPILVVQGEYDYSIGFKQANKIYAALKKVPENKKELHIIPNASHNLNMEAGEAYFDIVKSFLDKYN